MSVDSKVTSLKKSEKKSLPMRIIAAMANVSLLVILALFTFWFLAFPVQMRGHSMEPVISQNGIVLVNKASYHFAEPERFDIVAFLVQGSTQLQVKRVIALPGETVQINDGIIYINGTACDAADAYIYGLVSEGQASDELVVGEDEYFVLGDNAAYSEDSRFADIGMISKDSIVGKVWFSADSLLSMSFH